ncbi:hypothetical protein [Microterricola gilva]|uniref:hypothetical protein n=1 Tax=Microterricola gilva TaxID=393267 RepID=UPI0013EE7DC5|nr:hypothetical protein [Microterricola gilva]
MRQAKSHVKHIEAEFDSWLLSSVRPSEVKAWTAKLKTGGLADSTVYALHERLSHIAYGRRVAQYTIETEWHRAPATVEGLPKGFRIPDLRHYFASLLIAAGLDVKVVPASLRHASAKTTIDVHGRLRPEKDESARSAVGDVSQIVRTRCGLKQLQPSESVGK